MKAIILIVTSLLCLNKIFAGDTTKFGVLNPPKNPCSIYTKENIDARNLIPYTHLRESDVSWEKRVWREIDLREKQNQPLYYPIEFNACRSSLFQTLARNVLQGNIIAFKDEEFLIPYEVSMVRKKLVKVDTVDNFIYNAQGEETLVKVPIADSTSIYARVVKFRLKEDWFFDKQKSTLECRIVGLSAIEYNEERDYYKELFWVYFPACRPYFATNDVYNFKNDSERRSLDDIFWKRQFSSTIVKESNVYDRNIDQYQKGIDALVEAESIKQSIFKWEQDLWNY